MTDLRQGVTPTQHEVLDRIEQRAARWSETWDFEERLRLGASKAIAAAGSQTLSEKRAHAITAAALLTDAADEITRLISPEGTSS